MFSISQAFARWGAPGVARPGAPSSSPDARLLDTLGSTYASAPLRSIVLQGPTLRMPTPNPRGSFSRIFSQPAWVHTPSQPILSRQAEMSAVTALESLPSDSSSPYSQLPSFEPLPSAVGSKASLFASAEDFGAPLHRVAKSRRAAKFSMGRFLLNELTGVELPDFLKKAVFMVNDRGFRYYASQTLESGSFGKFKFVVGEDGRVRGMKVLRHVEKAHPKLDAKKRVIKRTFVTTRKAAREEVGYINQLSDHLHVEDEFEIEGKRYLVMTAMAGSLDRLMAEIDEPAKKKAVARSAAKQIADQLLAMQAKGYMHGDVKAPNTLVDEEGNIALSDFGKVRALDLNAPDAPVLIEQTHTYQAPEANWGRQAEVWALGVTLLELLAQDSEHPFSFRKFVGDNKEQFADWRADLVSKAGVLDFFALPRYVSWTDHAKGLAKADPKLFDFVIRDLLNPDPAERASMEQVCEKLATLVRVEHTELARTALRDAAQKMPNRATIDALIAISKNPPEFSNDEALSDALSDDDQSMSDVPLLSRIESLGW